MTPPQVALMALGAVTAVAMMLRWPGVALGGAAGAMAWAALGPGPAVGVWAATTAAAVLWRTCGLDCRCGLLAHPRWAAVSLSAVAVVLAPGRWVAAAVLALGVTGRHALAGVSASAAAEGVSVAQLVRRGLSGMRARAHRPRAPRADGTGLPGRLRHRAPAPVPATADAGHDPDVPPAGDVIKDQAVVLVDEVEDFLNAAGGRPD